MGPPARPGQLGAHAASAVLEAAPVSPFDDLGYLGDDPPRCRVCGCTDFAACPGGCWWVPDPELQGDLCSACAIAPDEPLEGGSA